MDREFPFQQNLRLLLERAALVWDPYIYKDIHALEMILRRNVTRHTHQLAY